MYTKLKAALRPATCIATLVANVFSPSALGAPIANPLAPIGFRPQLVVAPNGVTVVHIAPPSAAGTSHNQYIYFGVGPTGLVLNNSLADGTSVLGGPLPANPRLTGASATVILSEITGGGASSLVGALEVFGNSASVIVANPYGISCAGCSFINSPRVTLTTGVPTYLGDTLRFGVASGTINVSGPGLDALGLARLDLVAERIAIDGPVKGAAQLNLLAGRLEYEHASGAVTPQAGASGAGYAIDATALGKLEAGQVYLRATGAGVGVRALGGVAATVADIFISASGEVQLAEAQSARDLRVAAGALRTSGSSNVTREFFATVGTYENPGGVGAGSIRIDTSGTITNFGSLDAADAVQLQAGDVIFNRGNISATNTLTVTAPSIDNAIGVFQSRTGRLDIQTPGTIDNASGSLAGNTVFVQAARLLNPDGVVIANDAMSLIIAGLLRNTGQVLAAGDLGMTAAIFHNTSGITTGRDVVVNVATLVNGPGGQVGATRDMKVNASVAINNDGGTVTANRDATLSAPNITNGNGQITAVRNLAITATMGFASTGSIVANGNIELTGGTVDQGGSLQSGGKLVLAMAQINNTATIRSGDELNVLGGGLTNVGQFGSAKNLTIQLTGPLTNKGVLVANGDAQIEAASVTNHPNAALLALRHFSIKAGKVVNTGGWIQAATGDLFIDTPNLINERGPITTVYYDSDQRGSAGGLFGSRPTGDRYQDWVQTETTGPAQLVAGGNLSLKLGSGLNDASLFAASGNILIDGSSFENRAHQLLTTTTHTWYRWKSKWLGTKKEVNDVSYSWSGTPSTIQAGGILDFTLTGALSNSGNLIANKVNASAASIKSGIFDYYAQTPPTVQPRSAIDLSKYATLPTGPNQLFTENRDPASHYLIGIDPTLPLDLQLLAPDALLQALQADTRGVRFLADPFAEAAFLRLAALAQTGRAYFIPEAKTDEEQRRLLYEGALRFALAHPGVEIGEALSDENIAALESPILWYVRNTEGILVPTIYLPEVSRKNLANVQGGVIKATDLELYAIGKIHNTGDFVGEHQVILQADEFANEKRLADIGHIVKHEKNYWYEITGDTVQPGGFVSAANLQIQANRLTSISGEFYEHGTDVSQRLYEQFGPTAVFSTVVDRLNFQTHQYPQDPVEQIGVAAAAIALSVWLGPQMGFLVAQATAGTMAVGGIANAAISASLTGMTTTGATQLITSGAIDFGDVLKAGLTSGLTAIAPNIDSFITGSKAVTELGDKLVDYTLRAGITAGIEGAVYGDRAGGFGTAFVNSFVASAAADAANWVGAHSDRLSAQNIAGHALVGCAAAAAAGGNCGAGALGAATAAIVNPLVDERFRPMGDTIERNALLAAVTTAASGVAANVVGADIATAITTAQNETFNNYLSQATKLRYFNEVKACTTSLCNKQVALKYGYFNIAGSADLGECGADAVACTVYVGGAGSATATQINAAYESLKKMHVGEISAYIATGVDTPIGSFRGYTGSDLDRIREQLRTIAARQSSTGRKQQINIVGVSAGAQVVKDLFPELPALGITNVNSIILIQPAFHLGLGGIQTFSSPQLTVNSFVTLGAAAKKTAAFFQESGIQLNVKDVQFAKTYRIPPRVTGDGKSDSLAKSVFDQHVMGIDFAQNNKKVETIIMNSNAGTYGLLDQFLISDAHQDAARLKPIYKQQLLNPSSDIEVKRAASK